MFSAAAVIASSAASSSSGSIVGVVIGALGVGLPSLLYAMWRGRKIGPKEEEELVTRSANQAVEAMSAVLTAAQSEREEMQRVLDRRNQRITDLKEQVATAEFNASTAMAKGKQAIADAVEAATATLRVEIQTLERECRETDRPV